MKKRTLLCAAASALALATVCSFAACTPGTKEPDKNGKTEYVMEAEYIDIANVVGAGISSDQSGYQMIYGEGTDAQKKLGWSNGYYVGFTYSAECVLTFEFNADKADSAALIIFRLGSELGNITLTPADVEISLNGTPIQYGSFAIYDSERQMSSVVFKDYTVSSKAALVEGKNTVKLQIKQNKLRGTATGGPMVDCLKITTSSKLTYTDHTDNISLRDEI